MINSMHNFARKFSCWLFILWIPAACFSQIMRMEDLLAREELQRKIREEEQKAKNAVKNGMEASSANPRANKNDNPIIYANENELPAQEKLLIAVEDQVREKYSSFLKKPDTGIIKLLSYKENKLAVNDVRTQSAFPNIPGSGTYYSFVKRNHIADEWAQIRLYDGVFLPAYSEMKRTTVASSGGAAQTFTYTSGNEFAVFAEIGNTPLENVTLEHPAVNFLLEFVPPKDSFELANQRKILRTGIVKENLRFQGGALSKVDTTYAVRSINYKKTDAVYVFRVINQAADGGVLLLWQQVKAFSPIELKNKPRSTTNKSNSLLSK
jgi:hypothetical protein